VSSIGAAWISQEITCFVQRLKRETECCVARKIGRLSGEKTKYIFNSTGTFKNRWKNRNRLGLKFFFFHQTGTGCPLPVSSLDLNSNVTLIVLLN
jgi:hypothetical protein